MPTLSGLADRRGHRKTKKGNTGRRQHGGNRDKRDMKEFITVDDDGQFVMGKGVGGLGDFRCDLKLLFYTQNHEGVSGFFCTKDLVES